MTHEAQSFDAVLRVQKKGMLPLAFLAPLALMSKLELSAEGNRNVVIFVCQILIV